MTHNEAIDKVCKSMRVYGWACFPEVPLHSASCCATPIPDVIAIKRNFQRKSIAIFEVKVSRADFLQEIKKEKFKKSFPFADKFYYACPEGMIKPEEVPSGCGLYYIMPKENYCVCMKSAKACKIELSKDMLWSIILSYEKKYITKEVKNEH